MKKIITSVKLAPGNRGYFDPLTGMNLSISNNIGYVREDDNIDNIRKAIKEGKILIVGGQLPPAITIEPIKEQAKPKAKVKKPVKENKIINTKKKEKENEITEITIPVGMAKIEIEKIQKEEIKQEEPKKKLPASVNKKKDEPKEEVIKDAVKDGE